MTKTTLAECTQTACAYYTPDPGSSRMCRCIHPEKPNYMEGRCPLYKLDWQKASQHLPPRPAPPPSPRGAGRTPSRPAPPPRPRRKP